MINGSSNSPFFSIIVPVYKVQDYLSECVNSILKQTFYDFELILVDDGSPDQCPKICDMYMENNQNVIVIHKENGGLSSARNAGMDAAMGEYLIFLDGDDHIEPNSLLEIQKSIANDTDVVITRMVHDYPDGSEIRNNSISQLVGADHREHFLWVVTKSANTWPAPQYIVRTDFVKKHGLRFLEGFLHEDMDWTARLFLHSPHTVVCTLPWYHHRMARAGSITTRPNPKRVLDVYGIAEKIDQEYSNCTDASAKYAILRERIVASMISILSLYQWCDDVGKREIVRTVNEKEYLLCNVKYKKAQAFVALRKILGCQNALTLLSRYQNRKKPS